MITLVQKAVNYFVGNNDIIVHKASDSERPKLEDFVSVPLSEAETHHFEGKVTSVSDPCIVIEYDIYCDPSKFSFGEVVSVNDHVRGLAERRGPHEAWRVTRANLVQEEWGASYKSKGRANGMHNAGAAIPCRDLVEGIPGILKQDFFSPSERATGHPCQLAQQQQQFPPEPVNNGELLKNEENKKRAVMGQVLAVYGDTVTLASNVSFRLVPSCCDFLLLEGDWVVCELVKDEPEKSGDVQDTPEKSNGDVQDTSVKSSGDVQLDGVKAASVKALRRKKVRGRVTHQHPTHYIVNHEVFCARSLGGVGGLRMGEHVAAEVIESEQGRLRWRAIALTTVTPLPIVQELRTRSLFKPSHDVAALLETGSQTLLQDKENVHISQSLRFPEIRLGTTSFLEASVRNCGSEMKLLRRAYFAGVRESQFTIKGIDKDFPLSLPPGEEAAILIECEGKLIGQTRGLCIFDFGDFRIGRHISADITHPHMQQLKPTVPRVPPAHRRQCIPREESVEDIILGEKPFQPPKFVPVRLPLAQVPGFLWVAAERGREEVVRVSPALVEPLTLQNHKDKFTTLLHLEEIEMTRQMRQFDLERTVFGRHGEYLSLSMPGLCERRPSLMVGDTVEARLTQLPGDTTQHSTLYQGYVHQVLMDKVLLKFHPGFHNQYQGEDYSVRCSFNRTPLRRCHFALTLAMQQLGPGIVFPVKLKLQLPQVCYVDPEANVAHKPNPTIVTPKTKLTVHPTLFRERKADETKLKPTVNLTQSMRSLVDDPETWPRDDLTKVRQKKAGESFEVLAGEDNMTAQCSSGINDSSNSESLEEKDQEHTKTNSTGRFIYSTDISTSLQSDKSCDNSVLYVDGNVKTLITNNKDLHQCTINSFGSTTGQGQKNNDVNCVKIKSDEPLLQNQKQSVTPLRVVVTSDNKSQQRNSDFFGSFKDSRDSSARMTPNNPTRHKLSTTPPRIPVVTRLFGVHSSGSSTSSSMCCSDDEVERMPEQGFSPKCPLQRARTGLEKKCIKYVENNEKTREKVFSPESSVLRIQTPEILKIKCVNVVEGSIKNKERAPEQVFLSKFSVQRTHTGENLEKKFVKSYGRSIWTKDHTNNGEKSLINDISSNGESAGNKKGVKSLLSETSKSRRSIAASFDVPVGEVNGKHLKEKNDIKPLMNEKQECIISSGRGSAYTVETENTFSNQIKASQTVTVGDKKLFLPRTLELNYYLKSTKNVVQEEKENPSVSERGELETRMKPFERDLRRVSATSLGRYSTAGVHNGKHKNVPSRGNRPKIKYILPVLPLHPNRQRVSKSSMPTLRWFNKHLNIEQKLAVRRILEGTTRPLPYVIFGPPGTGKTVTLVEAALQILSLMPDSRVLVVTPSNSASDLVAERLLASGGLGPTDLLRLNAYQRSEESIPASLREFCQTGDALDSGEGMRRVTAATATTAGCLYSHTLHHRHYTHLLVDEAGQLTEPETLLVMGLVNHDSGQIVLAGDPKQLGPVVVSRLAATYGIQQSLLHRLCHSVLYQPEERSSGGWWYEPSLVTQLVHNYRSHPDILTVPDTLFYNNTLLPSADLKPLEYLLSWDELPQPGVPLLFHGIIGQNMQEGDSPSWFNPAEAFQVVRYAKSLVAFGVAPENIGIITPYRKQVEKVVKLLGTFGVAAGVKVGSVEEFQGQERQVVLISTVRSSPEFLQGDFEHSLGFVGCEKRFNVAVTRARGLLVVVGDPSLLTRDPCWTRLLTFCAARGAYRGPDLEAFIHDS